MAPRIHLTREKLKAFLRTKSALVHLPGVESVDPFYHRAGDQNRRVIRVILSPVRGAPLAHLPADVAGIPVEVIVEDARTGEVLGKADLAG